MVQGASNTSFPEVITWTWSGLGKKKNSTSDKNDKNDKRGFRNNKRGLETTTTTTTPPTTSKNDAKITAWTEDSSGTIDPPKS